MPGPPQRHHVLASADSERDARSVLDGKRRGRIVAGGLGLLLGLWFSWYTWSNVPFGTQDRPGAGVFPLVVGIGMVVVSVMTVVEALRTDQVSGEIRFPTGEKRRTVLLMAVAMVAALRWRRPGWTKVPRPRSPWSSRDRVAGR